MSSQFLIGGQKIEETQQFITALEEKQKAIRKEYEERISKIEQERIETEKNKGEEYDKFKEILMKQKDVMIGLTDKLNERDQTILQLQSEMEAYDSLTAGYESKMTDMECRIQQLEKFISEKGIAMPDILCELPIELNSAAFPPDTIKSPQKLVPLSPLSESIFTVINSPKRNSDGLFTFVVLLLIF